MTVISAFLCVAMLLALGGALVLTSMTETQVASAYRRSAEALHAVDGAAELAIQDLSGSVDWDAVNGGHVRSGFVDGPPEGSRRLPEGTTVNLDALATGTWQPFAYGPVSAILPAGSIASDLYVVVLAGPAADPQAMRLRAHAYGPLGVRRTIEVVITRDAHGHVRTHEWRELRQ